MEIVLAFSLILLALIVHEIGHAVFMHRYGVAIKEMGIGFPVPYLSLAFRISFVPFPFRVSPLLLGAYVSPTKEGNETLKALPSHKRAVIYGAGPLTNVVMGAVLFVAWLLIVRIGNGQSFMGRDYIAFFVVAGVAALSIFAIRFMSRYAIPVLGTLFLATIAYKLAESLMPLASSEPQEAVVQGPIAIVQVAVHSETMLQALLLGALINVGLACANMMPLIPLDGGYIIRDWIKRFLGQRVARVSTFCSAFMLVSLVVYIFASDLTHL